MSSGYTWDMGRLCLAVDNGNRLTSAVDSFTVSQRFVTAACYHQRVSVWPYRQLHAAPPAVYINRDCVILTRGCLLVIQRTSCGH